MAAPLPVSQSTPKRASKTASSQSLNHLLNFTLPPRQTQPFQSLPRRSRKTGTQQGVWNKERFVNAQYRFVMNPTGDYTVHFADPDIFFQWQDILQVIIPRTSALASATAGGERINQDEGHTTCPICLSPPTAARMTKCGHVFCFSCILHYLNTSDNKWARCPICFDSVNEKQLKSVKWFDGPVGVDDSAEAPIAESSSSSSSFVDSTFIATPRAGSTMRMRLMQRPQITTLALPRSHTWPSDLLPPHQAPFYFLPDVYDYAKFMLATPSYLITDLTRDLNELTAERRLLASMNDELEITFVDAAEQKLLHQIAKAAALETAQLKDAIDKALRDQREIEERVSLHERRRIEGAAHSPTSVSDVPEELMATKSAGGVRIPRSNLGPTQVSNVRSSNASPAGRNGPRQRRNLNPPPPSTSSYYYYQAASGLPLFLHPLDIKILFSHFNGYESFPDTISVRVESVAEGTVNDDLRKRCKYLAHMPEGADVVFVEADLHDVVGEDGLKNFEGPLRMRAARRREKERKDDRARARAEELEREKQRTTIPWSAAVHVTDYVADSAIPDVVEELLPPAPAPPPPVSGAWGARSFASAALTAAQGRPAGAAAVRTARRDEEDEWDIDAAWHDLERAGGGRRKRSNKLVVLGGGGGRRR